MLENQPHRQIPEIHPMSIRSAKTPGKRLKAWEHPLGKINRKALALPEAPDLLFRFAVYGDNQRGIPVHRRIVKDILISGAEVVLHTGDYVKDGARNEEWEEQFLEPARPLLEQTLFLGVLGNHDKESPRYYEIVRPPGGLPWFKATHGPVAFFGVDTNQRLKSPSPQIDWLQEELEKSHENWKIAFLHEAPYSSSWPYPGGAVKTRKYVMPLLEQYGVNLVFAGHIHNYERFHKEKIVYIITGGGGDTLSKPDQLPNPYKVWTARMHNFVTADVYPDRIVILARDVGGVPFDGVIVRKGEEPEEIDLPHRRGYVPSRSPRFPRFHSRNNRGEIIGNWKAHNPGY